MRLPARFYRMYPVEHPKGYLTEPLELNPRRTAFLLIDVYGKGFDPDGAVGSQPDYAAAMVGANREIVLNHVKPAKVAAKSAGIPIIYVTNYLSPRLTEDSVWRQLMLRMRGVDVLEEWSEPSDMLAFSDVIAPEAGDHVVKKQLFSGFFETHLDSLLRGLDVRDLVVVGFDSRICLRTTVVDAMYRNYRVIVLRDCVSTYEYEETRAGKWAEFVALRELETFCGYTSTSADWVKSCGVSRG